MANKKGGCLKWVGYVFIALLFMYGLASMGADDNESQTPKESTETISETVNTQSDIKAEVKEKKIYDKNNVSITVKSYDSTSNELNLFIKNKSNLNLDINAHAYSVNGIMSNNNIYEMDCTVPKKKKANATLELDSSFLKDNNIKNVKYIDVLFWAYDNDKSFKEFDTGVIRIKTNLYDSKNDFSKGKKIYNKKGIKVEYLRNTDNKFYFSVKNNSGNYIELDIENLSINGYGYSTDYAFDLMSVIVFDESQNTICLELENEFLSNNNIKKVKKIQFSFDVREKADYFKNWKTGQMKLKMK